LKQQHTRPAVLDHGRTRSTRQATRGGWRSGVRADWCDAVQVAVQQRAMDLEPSSEKGGAKEDTGYEGFVLEAEGSDDEDIDDGVFLAGLTFALCTNVLLQIGTNLLASLGNSGATNAPQSIHKTPTPRTRLRAPGCVSDGGATETRPA
jgi:hypothetical protein